MPAHPLKRLLQYAHTYRPTIRLAVLCSVLNKIFDLAPPLLIGAAVDLVVKRDDSWMASLGFETFNSQLWGLAAITVVIWVAESVFEYIFGVLWRNLAQSLQHDLRLDTYAHVQGLELAFFEDRNTGGLMAVLNDDVNQLERFLGIGANALLQVSTTVVVIGAIFLSLAPSVAIYAIVPMPFIVWGSVRYQRLLEPHYKAVREDVGALSADLAGNLSGVATIQSYTNEAFELERLRRSSDSYRESNRGAIRLSAGFAPLIRMIIVIGFTGTLVAGGHAVANGALAVGSFSIMVFMTQRLLWPLTSLGETFDLYQRAMASTRRIFGLLDVEPRIQSGPNSIESVNGELKLQNVDFHYRPETPIFTDLTLTFPAGQTTAIVGTTGAGKSTLIKLLLRFTDPIQGHVSLDGHKLPTLDLHNLRSAIGLVSQDVFLFHGTITENIAYGAPNATEADIVKAARIAEADEFIRAFPEGYDTVVGERGQKLSGGQRQRISIARAVLKNPPILILDEATSSVDNETEAAIQRSLQTIERGRTTILIAHRLSTVRHAHRIHVIEHGAIVESGTHDELVALQGVYAGLWAVQTGTSPQLA
jgi:ATP-binding cassette, subfamily B, bacterial